ncbi:hypothetical protein V8D89_005387 [Ganoderma adspersum]
MPNVSVSSGDRLSSALPFCTAKPSSPTAWSPSSDGKHGSPIVVDKDELARQKKAKHNAAHAKHGNYGSDTTLTEVIKGARKKLIEDKYKLSLEECGLEPTQYPLSDDQMTLLEKEETNLHSRVKAAVGSKICMYYGFHCVPANDADRKANAALVHWLLGTTEQNQQTRKSVFEYKNITSKEDQFQHPIIPDVLHEAFFKHDGALACTNQLSFNLIRHQTLALVLTAISPPRALHQWHAAIEHCIEQYISGTYDKHLKFSKDYYRVYDRHLNVLEQYTALEWKQYRKLLFRKGLAHANIQKLDAPPPALEVVAAEEIDADMASAKWAAVL